MLFFFASLYASSIVDQINQDPSSTWKAIDYPRDVMTTARFHALLGTKVPEWQPRKMQVRNDVPETFDAREQWPNQMLPVRNQGSCGSCWAFSISETVEDRLAVKGCARGQMSPQHLVSCDKEDYACNGGEMDIAWNWVKKNGIATEDCLPYTSGGGRVPECPAKCKNGSEIIVTPVPEWKLLKAEEMQQELMTHGPLSAGFTVYLDFQFYSKGVYKHKLGPKSGGHAILIIGWGVEKDTPYWLCQNSWGASWGMQGHFKILRGENHCGIEEMVTVGYVQCL
ncbi:putative Cathepsin B [Blattamonas nauphoetae]|uniref:Cathepsin B n=1 Tax=Blattamonas nauphoetae TaxID=2049346 RepID=A0ABQ9XKU3_9EUKA|nr:putative Cathepsin B [Blattamonas nauphoetae]